MISSPTFQTRPEVILWIYMSTKMSRLLRADESPAALLASWDS